LSRFEHAASDPAELGKPGGVDAVELVDAEAELAGEACVLELAEDAAEVLCVLVPDAVGDDLVDAVAELGGAAGDGDEETRGTETVRRR